MTDLGTQHTRDLATPGQHETERDPALMQAILDNVADGMALIEANGQIALANRAMCEINDIPRDVFCTFCNISDVFRWQFENGHLKRHHATIAEDVAVSMRLFLGGEPYRATRLRPNGRWVDVTWHTLPDGRRLVVQRDITIPKIREMELEKAHADTEHQRELIQSIIDNMPDAVVLCEANGDIAQWNDAVYTVNGFPHPGFTNIVDAFRWQVESGHLGQNRSTIDEQVEALMSLFCSSEPYRVTRLRPNGLWVESIWTALPNGRRMIIGRDVTELKRREERAAQERDAAQAAHAEAEAANQAKSTFLATMSHEIRTPMNGVLGMMEVLEQQVLTDDQRATLRVMRDSANALLHIVDDVLDFSKIEAGRLELEETVFSLSELATGVVQTFRQQAAVKRLRIGLTLEPGSADTLLGDPIRVRQVLFNLIGNAVKFTERGGVDVRVGTAPLGQGGQRVTLTVADTGIGMDQAQCARLFRPFAQADSSTTRRFGGTGLGLSIVLRLAQLMGGEVTVESVPGQGSVFTVSLAMRAAPAAVTQSAAPELGQFTALRRSGRILVVDDHPVNRAVLLRQLELLGLEADSAGDGVDALALWQPDQYAVVLVDLHMPRMDGYELTATIREREAAGSTRRCAVIAVTANALRGEAERCLAAGMDAYLAKPVMLAALRDTLARWLQLMHGDQTHGEPAPIVSRASLRDWFNGNEGAVDALLSEFLDSIDRVQRSIGIALERGELTTVQFEAHRLRGVALTVGAVRVAEPSALLERAAQAADPDKCRSILPHLFEAIRQARLEITDRGSTSASN
jgi:signal transduction histidine kinase/FixJ family two-component response regulator